MANKNILYGGDFDRKFNFKSMGDLIVTVLQKNGDRKALINASTGLTWTSTEFLDEIKKYAKMLFGIGVRRNSIIGIISENRHEVAALMFASLCLNAIAAPINFSYIKSELKHALGISKPKLIFVSSNVLENVQDIRKVLPYVEKIIYIDGLYDDNFLISLSYLLKRHEDTIFDLEKYVQEPINIRKQTSMIFLSSGTTGFSKGVEISSENLVACLEPYTHNIQNFRGFDYDINTLIIAPWFHVMGFSALLHHIFSEGRFSSIYLPKFEFKLFLMTIQSYKINFMAVAPPIIVLLAKSPLVDEYDISSLKYISTGAAPLSDDIEEQVVKRYKGQINIFRGYGLTEAMVTINSANIMDRAAGSVGPLTKGCYGKIIDENGNILGPNMVGEICHKGPQVMKGYFNNPTATAESIDNDGWFHTGDLGYFNETFQFFIVDRLKELIKYKGFQVAPAELEGLLLSNPKIVDAGVIGISDEIAGEVPMAYVVKKPTAEITESEVKDFVAKRISNSKWLRGGVKFIDEIPKNASGKILRKNLRELHKTTKAKL